MKANLVTKLAFNLARAVHYLFAHETERTSLDHRNKLLCSQRGRWLHRGDAVRCGSAKGRPVGIRRVEGGAQESYLDQHCL